MEIGIVYMLLCFILYPRLPSIFGTMSLSSQQIEIDVYFPITVETPNPSPFISHCDFCFEWKDSFFFLFYAVSSFDYSPQIITSTDFFQVRVCFIIPHLRIMLVSGQ